MAYASVASLMGTIESLLTYNSPMKSLICDHREEFLALREKVSSLEVFLKNFERSNVSGEMTDLEVKVTEVADDVEYTIQLSLTETVMGKNKSQKKKAHQRFRHSLQQIAENIDRICKESTEIQDKGKQESKELLVQEFSSSAKEILNIKNNIVGRDNQRKRLLVELTQYGGSSHELKVIPIIGMGGIGKTTLAKEVYNDASIRPHFDVRAWATVSQKHNVKDILVSLLRSTRGDELYMECEADLADMLQKSLKGKRYLIVMDDMWSSEAWDDVRLCFPSENKGSRILLTTRNNEVARSAGTENLSLKIGLMDPDESWNLFQSIVFSNGELPSNAFKTIGKKIVEECRGLPLAITVVAGLLNSKRTIRDWGNVAKDVKSFVTNPDEQCLHVLALSYNHLPNHLKACLLYFGTFPEDSEIPVKRLVRLWIAECFLKLEKDLEGEAEKCLQDLIDRCLVLVGKKSWDDSKMKSCKVHDLIHELCLREAKRENIFVMKDIAFDEEKDKYVSGFYRTLLTPGHHHLMQTDDKGNNLSNRTRSFFFLSEYLSSFTLKPTFNHFNLLRILDLSFIKFKNFPPEILCLIWLRYLAMYGNFQIPSKICRLWNLQTFIVRSSGNEFRRVSETIWELMQLRHLELGDFYLPNPPSVSVGEERHIYFPNIQTISGLSPSSCTQEVISGIRNAKKLEIFGDSDDYESCKESRLLENLVHLHQLEKLSFSGPLQTIPSAKAFPATLKKLKLYGTKLRWEELNIIGEIPDLEVLKLIWKACEGREWHPIAGGFTRLKLLLIDYCDLEYWKVTDDNFPVLERLVIIYCRYLNEIPIEFAEIDSLRLIELICYTPSLGASAKRIQQEQEDLGNKPVDLRISVTSKFTLEPMFNHFNLLRILDLSFIKFKNFPPEILCLIWLRYLAMHGNFQIPSKICRLWNLQTFIVRSSGNEFREVSETIWELMQLRHLELGKFYLPNPPSVSVGEERHLYFPNIQTISGLSPSSCTQEVISGIRNAKKLEIFGDSDDYESCKESRLLENLVHLHQLEKLSFSGPLRTIPSAKAFPATLKELELEKTKLRWEDLNIIGEIPNLEVLKLICEACESGEWHPIAGGFTRLKLLQIHNCDLKNWKATDDNFPVLERLLISFCRSLNEIPIEFAEIDSLQLIELIDCKPKLVASAERIQQEQEELVDVRISNTLPADYDDDDDDDDDIEDDEDEKEDDY